MRLAGTTYRLDEHKLPNGQMLYGDLHIEVDSAPYIWAMDVYAVDENGEETAVYYYSPFRGNNEPEAIVLRDMLHRDQKLMDCVYEACVDAAS